MNAPPHPRSGWFRYAAIAALLGAALSLAFVAGRQTVLTEMKTLRRQMDALQGELTYARRALSSLPSFHAVSRREEDPVYRAQKAEEWERMKRWERNLSPLLRPH